MCDIVACRRRKRRDRFYNRKYTDKQRKREEAVRFQEENNKKLLEKEIASMNAPIDKQSK